jgi:flagellar hook-associated protein 3 FlgL
MSMRIATAFSYDQSIFNLQQRQQTLAQSQVQLTSGKRVNVASDDPTSAARAERALASIARSEANQRSLDASRNVMNITESALGDAGELIQSARETLIAAGNGSYTDGERRALAVKLREIRNQLLSVSNRPDGGGGFVFGGQGSSNPPFVDTPNGVVFRGQGGEILASSSERLALTVDGQQTWLKARTGNGIFTTAEGGNTGGGANQGSAWINTGSVSSPADLPYPSGTPGTPAFSIQFTSASTYSIFEDGTPIATGLNYASGKAIDIPGKGMTVTISGAPANGDTFVIGDSSNDLSVFDSLDRVIQSLSTTNASANSVRQAVNLGMTEVDNILGNIQSTRSAVGESLNRMEGIESRISALKLAAESERSNAEDLDMVEAISRFQNQQTGYDAALKSYAMVQRMSLLNYLNP